MTSAGVGIDDAGHRVDKVTTTVAMDFGCVTIDRASSCTCSARPVRHASGSCGTTSPVAPSARSWSWTAPASTTATRPSTTSSRRGCRSWWRSTPSTARLANDLERVRWALAVADHVPVIAFDARDRLSVRDALLVVLDRALDRAVSNSRS